MRPVLGVDAGQLPNFILDVVFQIHLHKVDVFSQALCRHAGKLAIVVAGLDLFKLDFQAKSLDISAFVLRCRERGDGGGGSAQRSQQALIFDEQLRDVLSIGGGVSSQLFMEFVYHMLVAFDLQGSRCLRGFA